MFKLSVITINLNNAKGLRKTIESVVNQNYTDYEYIIIDGKSTDGSVEVIKEYENKIAYWVSEPDKGIYNAMNKGILKAKGEYLLMLNSGDLFYDDDSLNSAYNYGIDQDIVYGNILEISKEKSSETIFPDVLSFDYFRHHSIGHQAAFIKRRLHDDIGLYLEKFEIVSDWCFFLKAFGQKNCSYKHIPFTIVRCYRDGISCNPQYWPLILNERQTFLEMEFSFFINEYKEDLLTNAELNRLNNTFQKRFNETNNNRLKNIIKKLPFLQGYLRELKTYLKK